MNEGNALLNDIKKDFSLKDYRLRPADRDITLYPTDSENPCPLHSRLLEQHSVPFYRKYDWVLEYASKHTGISKITIDDIIDLSCSLHIENVNGMR